MQYDINRYPWEQDLSAIERAAYQRGDVRLAAVVGQLQELQVQMQARIEALTHALDNACTEFEILAQRTRGENRAIAKRAMRSLKEVD